MSLGDVPDGSIGDPWLDKLPGVVAGAFFRRRIAEHFTQVLGGEVHTYSQDEGLHLHLLRPRERGPEQRSCVVFLHGGGFLGGAPSQFYPYAKEVSQRFGATAACCEVSCMLTHPWRKVPFDTVDDARRCVRFLQNRAEDFGIDRQKIVLAGASSGGHTAAMAVLGESASKEEEAGLGLAGLLLFNPLLDLQFRSRWKERQLSTWLGAFALRARYGHALLEAFSPLEQVRRLPYPTMVLHGTNDDLVPLDEVEQFHEKMQVVGNQCSLITFPGEGHFFFNWRVSPANSARCVWLIGDILKSVGTGSAASSRAQPLQ
eukprot:TRINITY_DN45779_c0_g1_i1.p1 TRINITY_DN45779_c0_g1~~TRINITY_DN45779_c0_g1_i1.p1  ORF type:complete len:330 (+),score=61.93 TRINITY_DN45779_c0_g1_i1:45-992(+)